MRLLPVLETRAQRALSEVSGFLREAGFTHSLTPARNCTFGCTYCYVPTMRVRAGLRREDWEHWGDYTVRKKNLPELLKKELREEQIIYCSPLVDPYQPAEMMMEMMPLVLEQVYIRPPRRFVLQTRSSYILRDLHLLRAVAEHTDLRISFSITTENDTVRRKFEPRCETIAQRVEAVEQLVAAGLDVYITLAPILPCEPAALAELLAGLTPNPIIGDPLHIRATKPGGATTRAVALEILAKYESPEWAEVAFQARLVEELTKEFAARGRGFATGPEAFRWLTQAKAGS
ncbi:MAG: radical SAM protein [Bryobacter sp.]|nr:radical SAM protein [Bryobacter sp.]